MRKITVKGVIKSEVVKQADGSPAAYELQETLLNVLRAPLTPGAGTNYEEMAIALPLIRKVKNPEGDDIVVEKDEFSYLCQALKNYRFPFNDPSVYEWLEGILGTQELLN